MSSQTTNVIPHLVVNNASEAYEFYAKAFGATQIHIMKMPDGRVMHAALKFGDSLVYLANEFPEHGSRGPLAIGGSPVTIHLHVSDVDSAYKQAIEAGCTSRMAPEDMFWGDRYCQVSDPFGHVWSLATTVRTVSAAEMEQAMKAFAM